MKLSCSTYSPGSKAASWARRSASTNGPALVLPHGLSTNRCMTATVVSLRMLERGATLRARRSPLADLGNQLGPLAGLVGTLLLLAVLARTVGLGGAGWLVGLASGLTLNVALARALWRDPSARLGPAGWVTLIRATLAVGVAALTAASFERDVAVATLVTLASVALALDFVDGWLARRTGTESALGAKLDGEVDAFLILALSVEVAPVRRRLGARDRPRALRVPRGGMGAPVDARAAAAARLAQDGDGVAGSRAGDRGRGGPAVGGEPHPAGRRPRHARRVFRPRRLVAVAAPARPRPRRLPRPATATRRVTAVLTLLALLVVWAALVAPIQPWRLTPGSFVRLPLEGLVVVGLAVALPTRARRLVPWVIGPLLGVLVLLKLLDLGFFIAFDRPFNPVEDWSYLSIGVGTVRDTFGSRDADLAVAAAVVLGLAALVVPTLAVGRLTRVAARHRRRSLRAVVVLAAVWALCWVFGAEVSGAGIASLERGASRRQRGACRACRPP